MQPIYPPPTSIVSHVGPDSFLHVNAVRPTPRKRDGYIQELVPPFADVRPLNGILSLRATAGVIIDRTKHCIRFAFPSYPSYLIGSEHSTLHD